MRIASSRLSYLITDSTGPKISSCAMRMSLRTSVKIVGVMKWPLASSGSAGRWPSSAGVAPSSMPIWMYSSTLRNWPGADQRAEVGLAVGGQAHLDPAGAIEQPLHELVVDAGRHKEARAAFARLAVVHEGGPQAAVDGDVEVGVVEDDVGALAAQFQRHLLDRAGRLDHDLAAHFGAAGEGDLVDQRVGAQLRADHAGRAR